MKRLIQDVAKISYEGWCDVRQHSFMEKIDLFKQLLPFSRKIQVSVRRVIYLAFCRVFDLVVMVKEIK